MLKDKDKDIYCNATYKTIIHNITKYQITRIVLLSLSLSKLNHTRTHSNNTNNTNNNNNRSNLKLL